jgi:hypothetical protein
LRSNALWAAVAMLCAMAQFRLIMMVQGRHYGDSIKATQGVLDGMPHWRAFQSRLLGPWLVDGLHLVLGDLVTAHVVYEIGTSTLAGWLVLRLVNRLHGPQAAWGAFLVLQLLFAFLLHPLWLYAWDNASIVLFVVFTYFVMADKPWRWFAALFAVSIFNRESALYIPLWMVLDPLCKAALARHRPSRAQWSMIGTGVLGLLGGVVLIETLRSMLLVKEVGPELFNLPELADLLFISQWDTNMAFLRGCFSHFNLSMAFLIPLFLVAVLTLSAALAWRDGPRYLGLALTYTLAIGATFIAAVLDETRVMLELVPFFAMGLCAWCAPSKPVASPERLAP